MDIGSYSGLAPVCGCGFGRDDRELVRSGRGVSEGGGLAKLEGQTLLPKVGRLISVSNLSRSPSESASCSLMSTFGLTLRADF